MPKNYAILSLRAKQRANPESILLEKSFSDELSTLSYSNILTYIRVAMNGVEPEYTQKSKDAGEKVKTHLSKVLSDVSFRYQGSVMTNTHIKGYSDIDLLVISEKFYTWDSYEATRILESIEQRSKFYPSQILKLENEKSKSSYNGDTLADLKEIRLDCETTMKATYQVCDISRAKAIKIKNLSLNREVDIVVSNWYDDVRSIISDKGDNRGIQIYNKEEHRKESVDYPFVSIQKINQKSSETNGRLKKMIRFLKTVKADSELDIDLSSFDINAICFDIDVSKYKDASFYQLVPVLYYQLHSICTNQSHADNIVSVDEREYIFRGRTKKLENIKLILKELEALFIDLRVNTNLV